MVQNVYNKILDFGGKEEVPCVIVGAKTDLESRLVLTLKCSHLGYSFLSNYILTV